MPEHPEPAELLTSAPTEMEASIIVAGLEAEGIQAVMSGEFTAGFRAEAPGWVQILVHDADLPRAKQILEDVKRHNDHIDWSQVDVGQPEDEG